MTRVVVSGVNGAIGSELVRVLAGLDGVDELFGVFRSCSSKEAFLARTSAVVRERLRPAVCDLTDPADVARLRTALMDGPDTVGVHAAADVSWDRELDDIWPANVEATVSFASVIASTSRGARLVYVSSAFTRAHDWSYRNSYEASKAAAERLVRERFPGLRPVVFSCSLVTGHSRTGRIDRFHGIYPLIRLVDSGVPFLVASRTAPIDLVPVDWVAEELGDLVARLVAREDGHDVVAAAGHDALAFPDLLSLTTETMNRHRRGEGRPPLAEVPVISFRQWSFLKRSFEAWSVPGLDRQLMGRFEKLLSIYRPYLQDTRVRSPKNTARIAPSPRGFLAPVVDYWLEHGRHRRASVA